MKKRELLIITGITGFIGSHIVSKLDHLEKKFHIVGLSSKNIYEIKKSRFYKISKLSLKNLAEESKEITLIHLATFYSLNEDDREKIISANEDFGYSIFKSFGLKKVKKIIYTNSVFTFSKDEIIRNSTYVRTKKNFSKYLEEYSKQNSSSFSEIFLGNTFGVNDFRKKLIPNIISSTKQKEPLVLKDPEKFINLVPVDIIADVIIKEIPKEANKYSILSKFDYKILSIYEFCKNEVQKYENKDILKKDNNEKAFLPANIEILEINTNLEKELKLILSKK
tara:strand:- start:495 stop:1334 length:840 start_codon:yes stop_codon:yes gene_type:complete